MRPHLIRIVPLGVALAGLALSGCTGPKPFVREGDANSVEIGYSGDIASTLPLARAHCAGFERVPQLVTADVDYAVYDCIRR